MHRLADRATEDFATIRLPAEDKRTAIVAAGWGKLVGSPDPDVTGEDQPTLFTISNFVEPGRIFLDSARPEFEPLLDVLPPTIPGTVHDVGQRLRPDERQELLRLVRECLRRRTGPIPVALLLVDAVRAVAGRTNRVGKSVLVMLLPRTALDHVRKGGAMVSLQRLDPNRLSSLFVPEDSDDLKWSDADTVCGGVMTRGSGGGVNPPAGLTP
jgi:hypothetical protein